MLGQYWFSLMAGLTETRIAIMSLGSLSTAWVVFDVDDGVLVKLLCQDLDARVGLLLIDELFELAEKSGQHNLYVDFADVAHVSSAALAQLVVLDRALRDFGRHLSLFSLDPSVRELFQATQLTNLLDIHAIPLPRTAAPA
jgi:anti-anti-sigma factor